MRIDLEVELWMKLAALAIAFFIGSWLMMATMPDCANCRSGEGSFSQIWHGIVSVACIFGTIGTTIASIVVYADE